MVELDDTTFFICMVLRLADDEVGREYLISYMCEKGHEREKVELILDTLHEAAFRKGPLDSTKLDPEIRLAFARRIAEISGKTVEQVLVGREVLGRQGRVLF